MVLMSEERPDATAIDCEELSRAIYFQSGEGPSSRLFGFTSANGQDFYGGAVYCVGSSPAIANCVFERNSASQSPGLVTNTITALNEGDGTITCADCAPQITHCCVFENVGGDSLILVK